MLANTRGRRALICISMEISICPPILIYNTYTSKSLATVTAARTLDGLLLVLVDKLAT